MIDRSSDARLQLSPAPLHQTGRADCDAETGFYNSLVGFPCRYRFRNPMTASISTPLRMGAVNYLNSKPLIEGLAEFVPSAELVLDYPSRLADELSTGGLDIALIPSVECLRSSEYEVVTDACVAAHGAVMSVKLYSRVPLSRIRRLALDEGSRTSAALARIMLAERFGVEPATEPLPLDAMPGDTDADAILLIGDRAMHPLQEEFAATWDLAEEWNRWTGLPFVFAMWAARRERDLGAAEEALCLARDRGESRLAEIAAREAPLLQLSDDTALRYLTHNLHYRMGSAERSGLRLFQELAVKLGLAPKGVNLVFRDCTCAR